MSVDGVAARAGVSKPTVYLRHPSKAELATAAIASMRVDPRPAPTSDVRSDLIAHLRLLRTGLERPYGMATLGTVLAEEHETPELLALFRERLVAPRRRELRAVLEAARGRGELRPRVNLDIAVNALVGAFFARYLAGESLRGRFVSDLVDTVLDGLRRPSSSRPMKRGAPSKPLAWRWSSSAPVAGDVARHGRRTVSPTRTTFPSLVYPPRRITYTSASPIERWVTRLVTKPPRIAAATASALATS